MAFSDVGVQNLLGSWPLNGVDNFVSVFADPAFRTVVLQTLAFVALVMVATLVLGFLAAMLLRGASRVNSAVQTTMIFVWALPPVVVGSLWKFLLSSSGPVNSVLLDLGLVKAPIPFLGQPSTALFCIGLVTVWVGIPFAALVLKSAILDIPLEVWDAARVDGAGLLQTVWYVVLPAIRPTLYILGVLSVVGAFRGFDFIYVMTFGGPGSSSSTIPFFGYLTAFRDYQFGHAAAISVVAMVIVLGLAIAYIAAVRKEDR
ncbi:carbohydrate ABC transporter permease [Leifsonia sp. AG29]|uniref:carbohydrate ABC transporter permease n=1 Tax=Leifsonia sp. AG29 TaxID=2598860 RepID=UPI00131EA752|nr:sugar ABC transporter permease [Leifsonia sp. AG29]